MRFKKNHNTCVTPLLARNSFSLMQLYWSMLLLFILLILFNSCYGQGQPEQFNNSNPVQEPVLQSEINIDFLKANTTADMDQNIRSIFQDKDDNYWFGTNGAGVFRYDGISLIQFTEKEGLFNNQILSIQEDKEGNIWFGTGLFGVSRFDGKTFTTFTNKEIVSSDKGTVNEWKKEPDDLWFYAGGGVYRYDGTSLAYLPLGNEGNTPTDMQHSPNMLSRYAVYCMLKDKNGNLWFGTQAEGVCMYDGKSLAWFTELGLAGPAVLGLFEDKKGNLWFGNNGAGLFRYDGETLINFSEEKGLSNPEFRLSGKSGPNSLARIYAINEDRHGDLWIGTVDAGVWRYDGINLTHYTTKEGFSSDAVNTIFKDNDGELWFGTDADGICKFNGKKFEKFEAR
jgi:ligand-binding sensor domain-containing protein